MTRDNIIIPIVKIKEIFLYIVSIAVIARFDFLFDGANRYIPFRIFILLSLFTILIDLFNTKKEVKFNILSLLFIFFFLGYFLFAHLFWIDLIANTSAFIRNQFHFIYVLSGFFVTFHLAKSQQRASIIRLIKFVLVLVVIVVTFESILRFSYPTLDLNSDSPEFALRTFSGAQDGISLDTFYFFKLSSIMFFDSNYVGAFLLSFVMLNSQLENSSSRFKLFIYLALFLLIFLTFSRAAIFVVSLMYIFLISRKYIGKHQPMFITLTAIIALILLTYYTDSLTITDGSFISKLQIVESTSSLLDKDIITVIFGRGYEVGGYLYSYTTGAYAHVHIAILLGEIGVLGILVYLSYWLFIYNSVGYKMLYIFIPFFIIGFSLADPWEISYFWACGLISRL